LSPGIQLGQRDLRHAGEEVTVHQMADHPQVGHGGGADLVLVLHGLHADFHGQLGHLVAQVGERRDEFAHGLVGAVLLDEGLHQRAELLQLGAVVHQDLAAQQVERLDGVGALVDHVDAGVAHVLLDAGAGDEAGTAMHLHGLGRGDPAVVGHEGLHDRRQQRDHVRRILAHRLVGMIEFAVDLQGNEGRKCAPAFGIGLGGEQHAPHIRMHDDRIGRLVRRLGAGEAAHLQALFGVDQRVLVGHFGQAQALHADAEAGRVHHDEHGVETLVRLADQPAGCVVEVHLAGGAAMDAHLFLERTAGNRIARAEAAIGIGNELRHDEKGDSLGSGRRIGQAGQHQMDDVLRHVVLAGRDEDLAAGDLVEPSAWGWAFERSRPRSVPQCGSVRHMVPVHCPETSLGR
jgi:hypothetical protein